MNATQRKKTKSIISQNLWIAQKKIMHAKMIVRSTPIFSLQIWSFSKKILFLGAHNAPFQCSTMPITQKRDMMCYDCFSTSLIVSAHCASFVSRWQLLRGGGHPFSFPLPSGVMWNRMTPMSSSIRLNKNKTQLRVKTFSFMGHIISEDGLNIDPLKIEAITKFPKTENLSKLRS